MGVGRAKRWRRFDFSAVLFFGVLWFGPIVLAFTFGIQAGVDRNLAYRVTTTLANTVQSSLVATAGAIVTTLRNRPIYFLQGSGHPGDGVTLNDSSNDQSDLILIAGFFNDTNEVRLIRRNGSLVARWPVRFYDLIPNPTHFPQGWAPATNWNIDLHGALALPDGSVVFNFEWGGLVKLNRCGGVAWTIRRQTHHSVERAAGGGFWVLARRFVEGPTPYPPFETPFHEDTVLRVSEDGRILAEFSTVKIFYDNRLEALLTATGYSFEKGMKWDREIVHLNKVEELSNDIAADFPLFAAGDLVLSSRDRNLLMVVDGKVSKVKWWKIGPWIRQHDPEFKRGGTIVLFNNNIHQTAFGDGYLKVSPTAPRVTNIMEVDPVTGESKVIYGSAPGQELLSVIKGKVELTRRGGLLITEAQAGRVLETDAGGKLVWEYINRYSENEVAEIGEARMYPSTYFDVSDWTCH
jgi:hypothetical protein